MSFIKQWSTLICVSSLICVIAELMLPPGKMEKIMHMVLGGFIICVIISPFSKKISKSKINLKTEYDYSDKNKTSKLSSNIEQQVKELLNNNIKGIIFNSLKNINVTPEKIEIFMDTNADNCISIIKCKIFINEDNPNIRKQIINTIKNDLGIETEVIIK